MIVNPNKTTINLLIESLTSEDNSTTRRAYALRNDQITLIEKLRGERNATEFVRQIVDYFRDQHIKEIKEFMTN